MHNILDTIEEKIILMSITAGTIFAPPNIYHTYIKGIPIVLIAIILAVIVSCIICKVYEKYCQRTTGLEIK